MRRLITAAGLVLSLLFAGAACAQAPEEAMRLTIYTSHKEEVYKPIVLEFERRTGVWVSVVTGGTTELLERIEREADDPQADVMFGGGAESLMAYEDCFAPCDVPREELLESCRFEGNRFVAFSRLPLVIIYNPRLVDDPPQGWAALCEPRFCGQIAMADPGVSGSSFTAVATILQALPEEDALVRLAENVRGHVLPDSGDVVGMVASGAMSVGITLEETAVKRMLAGEQIEIVWPEEGTSAVPDGAAVLSGCVHPENAEAFLRFILSEDVQRRVQEEFARLPVRADLAQADTRALSPYDILWASTQKRQILAQWNALMREDEP